MFNMVNKTKHIIDACFNWVFSFTPRNTDYGLVKSINPNSHPLNMIMARKRGWFTYKRFKIN